MIYCRTDGDVDAIVASLPPAKCRVVASGCFDILHSGHVAHLKIARSKGDQLVVLVSDDRHVSAIKGAGRPVFNHARRSDFLSELRSVDYVIVHSQQAFLRLLRGLSAHLFVKGTDYPDISSAVPEEVKLIVGAVLLTGDPTLSNLSTTQTLTCLKETGPLISS